VDEADARTSRSSSRSPADRGRSGGAGALSAPGRACSLTARFTTEIPGPTDHAGRGRRCFGPSHDRSGSPELARRPMAAPALVTRESPQLSPTVPVRSGPSGRRSWASARRARPRDAALVGARLQLVAVVDRRGEARRCASRAWATTRAPTGTSGRCWRPRSRRVFVCGPQHERAASARLALDAGAAVFVEHPFGVTLDEARAVAAEAEESGRPLACACGRRSPGVHARARGHRRGRPGRGAPGAFVHVRLARLRCRHPAHHEPGPVAGGSWRRSPRSSVPARLVPRRAGRGAGDPTRISEASRTSSTP